jgi:hypothetical protein
MEILRVTLAAGERKSFHKEGRYFEVMKATGPFDVHFTDRAIGVYPCIGLEAGVYSEMPFQMLEVQSATAQTVTLMLSNYRAGFRPGGAGSGGGGGSIATGSPVNASGTITAANTSQGILAANAARVGFWIQNNSTGDLWINELGAAAATAQPSFKLPAGALYETPSFVRPTASVQIIGATAGQAFTAREW